MGDFPDKSQNLPVIYQEIGARDISQGTFTSYNQPADYDLPFLRTLSTSAPSIAHGLSPSTVVEAIAKILDLPSSLAHQDAMRQEEILDHRMARISQATIVLAQLEKLGDSPAKQYLLNAALTSIDPKTARSIDEKA